MDETYPQHIGTPTPAWRALEIFCLYRLGLSVLLLIFFWINWEGTRLALSDKPFISALLGLYVAYSLIVYLIVRAQQLNFNYLLNVQVIVDIVVLTLLLHASRYINGNLAILINVTLAGGSLLGVGIMPFVFASIATLCILLEQVFTSLNSAELASEFMHSGILGLSFFATATVGYLLSTRLKRSEALASQRGMAVARLEQVNAAIIARLSSGILVIDDQQHVRLMNDAARVLLGKSAATEDMPLSEICAQLASHYHAWQKNPELQPEPFCLHQDGPWCIAHFSALETEPLGVVLIFLDDPQRTAQHAQALKLASLGRFSASIAHEIRNPLSAISHAAQLLQESSAIALNDARLLEIIHANADRVDTIIENVLNLSRRKTTQPELLHLHSWLQQFVSDLRTAHDNTLYIEISVAPADLMIRFDATQLTQALTNFCENGLRYSQQHIQAPRLALTAGKLSPSGVVYLDVIDFGVGIEPALLNKIFEPFYTTEHQGTGLGLYMAKEICEANHARLEVSRAATGGACFRIVFLAGS